MANRECRWYIEAVDEVTGYAMCVAKVDIPDLGLNLSFGGRNLPEDISQAIRDERARSRWGLDIQGYWDEIELKPLLKRRDSIRKDRHNETYTMDPIGIVVSMMEGLSKRISGHSFRLIGWAVTPTPTE